MLDVNWELVNICHRLRMDAFPVFVLTSSIQLVVFIAILDLNCREDRQSEYACPMANGVEPNLGDLHTSSLD